MEMRSGTSSFSSRDIFKRTAEVLKAASFIITGQPLESTIPSIDRRREIAAYYFKLFNHTVFNDKLPVHLPVTWNRRLVTSAGRCIMESGRRRRILIELSNKILDTEERIRDTLLHEMCHAACWILDGKIDANHEDYFKYWAKQAQKSHPDLPPVNDYHNYHIRTRYIYKCHTCHSSVGRHTKSMDLHRCACSDCGGRFELLEDGQPVPNVPKVPRSRSDSGRTRSRSSRSRSRSTVRRRRRSRPARCRSSSSLGRSSLSRSRSRHSRSRSRSTLSRSRSRSTLSRLRSRSTLSRSRSRSTFSRSRSRSTLSRSRSRATLSRSRSRSTLSRSRSRSGRSRSRSSSRRPSRILNAFPFTRHH